MASSTAKMRAEVMGLTNVDGKGGVDIMADEETFRSTYDIMNDIAQVWDKMSDINRSALLEKLAGKVRSNQVAALLENFDQAEKALETSQGAEGTMNRVHQRWLDSVEARQAQFNASVEAASMTAMPANTLKGLYQAGTTGMNMLNNLMGNVFGLGVGAGSGGVGAGVLGVASLLRSGNGDILGGLGRAFNIHKGGRGQADVIAAYNRAFQDTTSITGGNKAASLQAAERAAGAKGINTYTRNLIENADTTVDAAKATAGLTTSLKSMAKNALVGIGTFAAIELAATGLQALWKAFDEGVLHQGEHLASVASTSFAAYETSQRAANAAADEAQTAQEKLDTLRGKENRTTEETQQMVDLESQMRALELAKTLADIQARQASDQAFKDWASTYEFQRGQQASSGELFGTLLSDVFRAAAQQADTRLSSEPLGAGRAALQEDIERLKQAAVDSSYETAEEYLASRGGQRAAEAAARYGYDVGTQGAEQWFKVESQAATERYARQFAETDTKNADVLAKTAGQLETLNKLGEIISTGNYDAATLTDMYATYQRLSSGISVPTDRASVEAIGTELIQQSKETGMAVENTIGDQLANAKEAADVAIKSYVGAGKFDTDSPQVAQMRDAYQSYMQLDDAMNDTVDHYDALNAILKDTPLGDVLSQLTELGAAGKLTAEGLEDIQIDGVKDAGANFVTLLKALQINTGSFVDTLMSHIEASEEPPSGGGAVADTRESSQANIDALLSAQQAAAKIWKDSGFTGALDTTSKDFTELMAMDGGAYQAALERANGGLFFSKDAFDKIVQQKYREELAALRQDVLKTQQKYTEAATKVVEEMKSGTVSQESYEAMLGYGTQLTEYANRMAQINYGMSDMANWISNKGGAESGDAYDELGEAINAITGGKSSGLTGTREFAAAMRFVTGKEIGSGAGQVLLGDLSSKTMSYMQALGAVDKNGKPDQAARRNALAAFQKDMKAAGILDKTGAVAVAGMTTGQMADKFNEKYGTQFGADFMQSILMGINDYIQDPAEKYDISTETPESKRAEEARKNFQDAVKAWREAPADLEDAQKQALLDGVVEAGEAMTKAQLQDMVANGSTEQAAAAAATLANLDKQETADPLTSVLGKLDATLSALNTTLSKENKDEEGGKKGKGADEYQDTKEVPDKPAFTSGKSTFASAEAETTSLAGLTQEIKDYESKHGGSDALTELIGEAENEGASYDTILEKWNNYRSNVEEAEQQAVQQAAEEAKSSKWSFGKLADQYDDTKTIRDKPKRTFTTGPSTFQDAEEAGKALADLGEQAKALEKQYGSSDALTELIGEIETEGADYDTMLNKLNNVRSDLEEAAANATEAETETAKQLSRNALDKGNTLQGTLKEQEASGLAQAIEQQVAEDLQEQAGTATQTRTGFKFGKLADQYDEDIATPKPGADQQAIRDQLQETITQAQDAGIVIDEATETVAMQMEDVSESGATASTELLRNAQNKIAQLQGLLKANEASTLDEAIEPKTENAEDTTVVTGLDQPLTTETAVSGDEEKAAKAALKAQKKQEELAELQSIAEDAWLKSFEDTQDSVQETADTQIDTAEAEAEAMRQRMKDAADLDRRERAEQAASDAAAGDALQDRLETQSKLDQQAQWQEQLAAAVEQAGGLGGITDPALRKSVENATNALIGYNTDGKVIPEQDIADQITEAIDGMQEYLQTQEQEALAEQRAAQDEKLAELERERADQEAKDQEDLNAALRETAEQTAETATKSGSTFQSMEDVTAAMANLDNEVRGFGGAHDVTPEQQQTLDDISTSLNGEYASLNEAVQAYDNAVDAMNQLRSDVETSEQTQGLTQTPPASAGTITGTESPVDTVTSASVEPEELNVETKSTAVESKKSTNVNTGTGTSMSASDMENMRLDALSTMSRLEDMSANKKGPDGQPLNQNQLSALDKAVSQLEQALTDGGAQALQDALTTAQKAESGVQTEQTATYTETAVTPAVEDATATVHVETEEAPPVVPPEEPTVTVHTNVEDPGSISVPTPPTVTIPVQYGNPGEIPTGGGGGGKDAVRTVSAAAGGTDDAAGGMTLVDELGAELIEHRSRGTYELGTNNGARFVKLDAGDVVHNAKETRKILKRGMAMANGGVVTGRAMSSISNGTDMTGGSDQAAAIARAQRDAAAAQEAAAAALNSSDRKAKALLEWIKKVLDWIPTYLNELKKKTTQFVGAADDAVHYLSQNKLLDSAIENIAEEIQANISSVVRYRSFLREMQTTGGLSDEIVAKIQNGTIDLEAYNNEETVKAIQAYQQYWEKLVACQEALATLNDQMEALSQQKLDNVVSYFDRIDGLLRDQQKRFEGLIDLKKQYGQELTGADYMDSLTNMEQILANAQNEEQALLKELEDQLGVGGDMVQAILNGGKDVWEAIAAHVKKGVDEGVADLQEAIDENLVYRTVAHYNTGIGTEKLGSMTDIAATSATPEVTQLSLADVQKIATGAMNINLDQVPASQRAAIQAAIKGTTSTFSGATNKNAQVQAILDKIQAQQQQYSSKQVNQQTLPPVEISLVDVPVTPATDEDMIAIGEMLGMNVADGSEEALKNLEAIKSLFTTSWDNPLAIGSDTWYSYMSTLENLKESITQTKIEISEMNDTIADIPLTNLKTGYDYLEEIQRNLEGMNNLLDAQGSDKYAETYRSLISVGMQQIENLQEQNRLIEEQMSTLDPLSEKYQELRGDLTSNLDTIADIRKNQEEWNDAIIDLQIERLKKQNDSYKEQLRLMQALDDLDKARQRRLLIYHEDTGFQYEADEDELENAQEAANDAIFSSIVSDLEKSKADSNIYGPLGERLISGSSILDSLGNVLVPVEDKLSGLDFEPYYQSIVSGSEQSGLLEGLLQSIDLSKLLEASIGGSVNIDIGTMTLNEVQNAKDLGDAIINQLPSYLLQALYQKGAN